MERRPDRSGAEGGADRPVVIPVGSVALAGDLAVPAGAGGLVLFAHGSGSSRHSPRNRAVARALNEAGLGTLLIDLLSAEEEIADARDAHLRFDIALLADRLVGVADWLAREPGARSLPLGLFGASTGAAAALVAAAERPHLVRAVVSRGGRPDLAGQAIAAVAAPTLLLVGGADDVVLELNRRALAALRCAKELVVIPGATHLFEEPGALEEVARLAARWFTRHLGRPGAAGR
jgi:putative phosphoribosyl transferase